MYIYSVNKKRLIMTEEEIVELNEKIEEIRKNFKELKYNCWCWYDSLVFPLIYAVTFYGTVLGLYEILM